MHKRYTFHVMVLGVMVQGVCIIYLARRNPKKAPSASPAIRCKRKK